MQDDDQDFNRILNEKLNAIYNRNEYDRCLNCLKAIGKHCPAYLNQFHLKIFLILPKLNGILKAIALGIILQNAESTPDLWERLQPELNNCLVHRDDETQLNTLKLLLNVSKKKICEKEKLFVSNQQNDTQRCSNDKIYPKKRLTLYWQQLRQPFPSIQVKHVVKYITSS